MRHCGINRQEEGNRGVQCNGVGEGMGMIKVYYIY